MRLVLLDRDGVINEESDEYIKSPEEWIPIPGSLEAIRTLNHAGYTVVIVTNQSGIGRGILDITDFHAIHHYMDAALNELGARVDSVFFCPHRPDDDCDCRKPKPGLLHQVERRYGVSLHDVPFVGDKRADVEAAEAVGAEPVLVLTGRGQDTLESFEGMTEFRVFDDLAAFAEACTGHAVMGG